MNRREITDLVFLGTVVTMILIAALFAYSVATGQL